MYEACEDCDGHGTVNVLGEGTVRCERCDGCGDVGACECCALETPATELDQHGHICSECNHDHE